MPGDGIKKLYYSIGEVSEMTGLEQHVLRYWETEFEELQPRKNRAGRRVYTADDIAMVRQVQYLLKERKFTIEGAKQVLAQPAEEGAALPIRDALIEMRAFLQDLLTRLPAS